jgi:hypothetical protein
MKTAVIIIACACLIAATLALCGCANTYNEQTFAEDSVKVINNVNVGNGPVAEAVAAILAEAGWPLVWNDVIRQGTEATSKGQVQADANLNSPNATTGASTITKEPIE